MNLGQPVRPWSSSSTCSRREPWIGSLYQLDVLPVTQPTVSVLSEFINAVDVSTLMEAFRFSGPFKRLDAGFHIFSSGNLQLLLPHASKVLFLDDFELSDFFVCASNISGTAERICQIHSEDVFGPSLGRVWMWRSMVSVVREKNCWVIGIFFRSVFFGSSSLALVYSSVLVMSQKLTAFVV